MKEHVAFKSKRLEAAELSKNYKIRDQLSEKVAELNKSKWLLELELGIMEKSTDHNIIININPHLYPTVVLTRVRGA